jgi:hypothetical protein
MEEPLFIPNQGLPLEALIHRGFAGPCVGIVAHPHPLYGGRHATTMSLSAVCFRLPSGRMDLPALQFSRR